VEVDLGEVVKEAQVSEVVLMREEAGEEVESRSIQIVQLTKVVAIWSL
jgi:hypothetical protein